MHRQGARPLHVLPQLQKRESTLEKCVFCPKLCRSACPVSNAEPRETLTPWGKMSMAYFVARDDVPREPSYAAPAWACTGCYGCRESCDHRNDVSGTLLDARAGLLELGIAPPQVSRAVDKFASHDAATHKAVEQLRIRAQLQDTEKGMPDAMLVGCGYARGAKKEALHAVKAATSLVRRSVRLIDQCCGLPLLLAGDVSGFERHAKQFDTRGASRLIVHDPGCAITLRNRYPSVGATLSAKVELLVELAATDLVRFGAVPSESADDKAPVRYHDPCQLGRGLGVYEAPRAILTRALGRPPEEFSQRRDKAACSGGGGLLPVTMPETSRAIADARVDEHSRNGGGRIVTACASSLRSLRQRADVPVDDIATWIARSIEHESRG